MDEKKETSEKDAYKTYLSHIKEAGSNVTEIFKAVQEGEPAERILLKCAECISKMIGDPLFYNEISGNLNAIYGEALLEKAAVDLKIEEIEDRLSHLREAMKRESIESSDKERIERAIQANESKIKELHKLCEKE